MLTRKLPNFLKANYATIDVVTAIDMITAMAGVMFGANIKTIQTIASTGKIKAGNVCSYYPCGIKSN